nr:MAG TPA: hypothetical protein [Caudoviricetes sp.]
MYRSFRSELAFSRRFSARSAAPLMRSWFTVKLIAPPISVPRNAITAKAHAGTVMVSASVVSASTDVLLPQSSVIVSSIHLVRGSRSKNHPSIRLNILHNLQPFSGRIESHLNDLANQFIGHKEPQRCRNTFSEPRHNNRKPSLAQLGADELLLGLVDGFQGPLRQKGFVPQPNHAQCHNHSGHYQNRPNNHSFAHFNAPFLEQLCQSRLGLCSYDAISCKAMALLELLDRGFRICPEDSILRNTKDSLQNDVVDSLGERTGCFLQIRRSEKLCRPVRGVERGAGRVGDAGILMNRHIASFHVIDADFPVKMASRAMPGASLHADQVTGLDLLPGLDVDLGKMPEIHEVGACPDTDHDTLPEALLRQCCALPSRAHHRAVYRAVQAFSANSNKVISLVVGSISPQMPICLRYPKCVFVRRDHLVHLLPKRKTALENPRAARRSLFFLSPQ